jgi:hypothetical protein
MRSLAVIMLKERGHELIDELRMLGMPRHTIYAKLERRMGRKEWAHFSTVDDLVTLHRMVLHLGDMLANKRGKRAAQPERPVYDYSKMFTDKAVLRAVGERNRRRLTPWWRRALYKLRAILTTGTLKTGRNKEHKHE